MDEPTLAEATEAAENLQHAFEARAKGLAVKGLDSLTDTNRVSIKSAVTVYLEQKSGKAKKTQMQYRRALNEFVEALGGRVRFLDEVTDEVLTSGVRSKAANGDHVKTGQRMWPGTWFFYPIFS